MNEKLILLIATFGLSFLPTVADALPKPFLLAHSNSQEAETPSTDSDRKGFINVFRPPNPSQPKYTFGGASRNSSCGTVRENGNQFKALVPAAEQSLTTQERPTLFAYVSPLDTAKSAMLVVKNKDETYYYSQKHTVPAAGGIIELALNEDAPSLEVGQSYTWFLQIHCDSAPRPEDPYVGASISRVDARVPKTHHQLDRDELLAYYASSELWYDSLQSAFELSQSGQDVYWSQLLQNIGMDLPKSE